MSTAYDSRRTGADRHRPDAGPGTMTCADPGLTSGRQVGVVRPSGMRSGARGRGMREGALRAR